MFGDQLARLVIGCCSRTTGFVSLWCGDESTLHARPDYLVYALGAGRVRLAGRVSSLSSSSALMPGAVELRQCATDLPLREAHRVERFVQTLRPTIRRHLAAYSCRLLRSKSLGPRTVRVRHHSGAG